MSKRVQYAQSFPELGADPANEASRVVVYTKSDGLYARLASGAIAGPFGPADKVQSFTGTRALTGNGGNTVNIGSATLATYGPMTLRVVLTDNGTATNSNKTYSLNLSSWMSGATLNTWYRAVPLQSTLVPSSSGDFFLEIRRTSNATWVLRLRDTDTAMTISYVIELLAPAGATFTADSTETTLPAAVNALFSGTPMSMVEGMIGVLTDSPLYEFDVVGTIQARTSLRSPSVTSTGLTGATAATRYVGGTASGAPTTGTFAVGDYVIARNGHVWICTAAGSPGTWTDAAGSASGAVTSVNTRTGAVTGLAEDSAVVHLTGNETIAGVKTFGSTPVVPDGSFGVAKLSASGAKDGTKFLRDDNTWVVPSGAVTSVNTRSGAVTGLAEDNTVVHLTGNETIAGTKTFSSAPVVPNGSFGVAKLSATGTPGATNFLRGDNTWATMFSDIESYTMAVTGTLTVTTGKSRIYVEGGYAIDSVRASVNTVPTGSSIVVDVNVNGTTIFSTQANRPTIAAGTNTSGRVTNYNTTTVADGDYITVDVDAIGSTVAGADLTVTIRLRRTS